MKYIHAKRLHNEDEVIFKRTGVVLRVVKTEVDEEHKDVFAYCDDGSCYHHTALK